MAKNPPWLEAAVVLFGICGLAASSVSAARTPHRPETRLAYLRTIGPAPLRFQPPPSATPRIVLSALFSTDAHRAAAASLATNAAPASLLAASTNRPATPTSTAVTAPVPATLSDLAAQLALPVTNDRDAIHIPDLDSHTLLEYLAPPSTNAPSGTPPRWPTFVPPVAPPPMVPPPARSSQATYERP
jgi:hypothetical protein